MKVDTYDENRRPLIKIAKHCKNQRTKKRSRKQNLTHVYYSKNERTHDGVK